MIVAAHQTMMAPPALPYDAEVEYLSSDGNQWIDTGVIPQIPDDLTCTARILWPNVSVRKIMGKQGGFYFGVVNRGFQPGMGSKGVVSGLTVQANVVNDIMVRFAPTAYDRNDGADYNVNGTSGHQTNVWYTYVPDSTSPFWIFAANNATTLRGASSVYSFAMVRSGTTIRDYIPVRVGSGSSAVGYLFDRVSGTLFGNAGTGAFTIGPDK